MGGGAKSSLSHISRQSRSIVCHRLQMGAARTSYAREINNMYKEIEKGLSNQVSVRRAWSIGNGQLHDALSPSREVSKTLNCMDDPMKVLIIGENDDAELGRHSDISHPDTE